MIDSKTLTIGCHVLVSGRMAEVVSIDSRQYTTLPEGIRLQFSAVVDGEKRTCGCLDNSDVVQPIPITEDILERLGFVREELDRFEKNSYNSRFIDKKSAELKKTHELVIPRIIISFVKDWTDSCIVYILCGTKNINGNFNAELKYLHEVEVLLQLTTGEKLIE